MVKKSNSMVHRLGLIPVAAFFLGCGNPLQMASKAPGLRQLSDSMNERAFVRWMESDPGPQVRARVAKGDYQLLGLAIYDRDDYWIPGVAGHRANYDGYDVTWQGMGGAYEKHIPLAETYAGKFNALMLIARKGVDLDVYGRGPNHKG